MAPDLAQTVGENKASIEHFGNAQTLLVKKVDRIQYAVIANLAVASATLGGVAIPPEQALAALQAFLQTINPFA